MRFPADIGIRSFRIWLVALLAGACLAGAAPAAQAAFGVESFFAANCNATSEGCNKAATPAEEKEKAEKEGYTQAAGHPPFGITDFTVNTKKVGSANVPEGVVSHIRTDVAPGVSTNPEAVPKCSMAEFGDKEVAPGTGVFPPPTCPGGTVIGANKVVVAVEPTTGVFANVPLEGTVYNLEQAPGLSSDFGVALSLAPLGKAGIFAHTLIEGHVEWASDYHDYFDIHVAPTLPLVSSRLVFKGNIGTGGFLTNPTSCTGIGPQTTSTVTLDSTAGQRDSKTYTTPIGTENCTVVPFAPTFSLIPETTRLDLPDGVVTELKLPHDPNPENLDSSQLRTASVTLPEGMTLNPSAARGLEACTPAQARITSKEPGVACPAGSKLGTVTLNVPGLPPESLQGNLYLGGPESGPITQPPYTMYIDAESARYGLSVRLMGSVTPDPETGRVTATFAENPEQPFSNLILHFNGGALAPLANPLACGTATTETSLTPFTGTAAQAPISQFTVDNDGAGGACPAPLAFAPTQNTTNQSATAGALTSFTFTLVRPEGQPYLSQVKTVLPPGLVGPIPSVTLCGEQQANDGTCPESSKIGVAGVLAGSGPSPFAFGGSVYLTGPYEGAPYGLSIVVPAVAGPFNLGNVVTRAAIDVDQHSGQLIVTSKLPTIATTTTTKGGIPLRLRQVTVSINRQNFLFNPTNCGQLKTESTVTGFVPGSSGTVSQTLSTPFQVGECSKLAFKPSFKASTRGQKTSRANGASIEVKITQGAHEANIQKVETKLPKQLPSRLTTLNKACLAATFEVADPPGGCSEAARVGGATATTPVLPGTLSGPAYLVSHGGEAFPDLDVILRGSGVVVVLVGHTHISKGITTTTFESLPDVPVSSFALNLPIGPHSALAANGNLCTSKLTMPTTIVAQSGAKLTQKTKISAVHCPVRIVGHRTSGTKAVITVKAPEAGRVSGSGPNLNFVTRRVKKATKVTINVPLSRNGQGILRKFHQLTTRLRVGFIPKPGSPTSTAHVTVIFRS